MTAIAENPRYKSFEKKLNVVMLAYAREFPFWGVMSERCSFRVVEGKESFCQTACIDKRGNVTFNLDFYEKLTDKQFLFLVAHELSHFVFEHLDRRGSREPLLWNYATDYAINLMLKFQFEKPEFLIPDTLLDHKYEDMQAERIYEELKKNPPPKPRVYVVDLDDSGDGEGDGSDADQPGEGDVVVVRERRVPLPEQKPGQSKEQHRQEMKDYIKQAVCDAYTTAKNMGKMPAGMERIIVGHLKPKVNWLQALRQKLRFGASRLQPRDTTWMVPNRRFSGASFVFPSTIGPESPKIVFAVDTSGSMSEQDLKQAIGELEDIRKKFQARVYFMDCDAGVYASRWLMPHEKLPALQGGGGTDFAPVFEHLISKRIKPDYCVFFTDGFGNFGNDPSAHFKVLWVITNQQVEPPFGDVVRVNVDNESK
jgi:predicted metal-dependent peptidase